MKRVLSYLCVAAMLLAMLSACGDKAVSVSEASVSSEAAESSSVAQSSSVPESSSTPEAKPTGTRPGTLSDDIYSFQLQIDGEIYQFPMTYADFISYGWEYEGDEEESLDSYYVMSVESFNMGELECYADIVNFDINALPVKDCYIGGINIDNYSLDDWDAEIVVPGGLVFGEATAEDVRAAFGTPSYENKLDSGTEIIEYEKDYDQMYGFWFDAETGIMNEIEIENYVVPDDFEAGEVSGEVPAIVTAYQAPAAMSDDLADFTVEFGGKLYQLPAPISEFEADGWTIDESNSDTVINGRGYGWVTLMKDNQKLRTIAQNYSDSSTAVNNCFLTDVMSDPYDCKIPLTISGGISIDTTEADLLKAIANVEYETSDSSSYRYYELMPTGSKVDGYEIYVSTETDLVYKIEASYQPKFDDYTSR